MAEKRFKLKFSGVVKSFQLCRSKDLLDSHQPSPPAANYYRRKATGAVKFPAPPHSTPDCGRRRGIIGQHQKVPPHKLFPSCSISFSDDSSFDFARVEIKSRRRGGQKEESRRGAAVAAEGKVVKGSVAVRTKSEDPREDFRRSMLEMILEKELFGAEDLEQLLHCFLSLNYEAYHRVILEAFIDVWQELFSSE